MTGERTPTYEELQAHISELELRDRADGVMLRRINEDSSPLNRTLRSLLFEMSRDLRVPGEKVFFGFHELEDGQLLNRTFEFGYGAPEELTDGDDPASTELRLIVTENRAVRDAVPQSRPMDDRSPQGRAARERRTVYVADFEIEAAEYPDAADRLERMRELRREVPRSTVCAPMLLAGELLGVILSGRQSGYTADEIAIVERTAEQMALAIGNARMAEQLEQRNRELAEALERQKATSDVLEVVGRSLGDAQPVFEAILAAALRLAVADVGNIRLLDADGLSATVVALQTNPERVAPPDPPPDRAQWLGKSFPVAGRQIEPVLRGETVNVVVPDIEAFERLWPYEGVGIRRIVGAHAERWPRAELMVPLLLDDRAVGAITVARTGASGPFPEPVVELMQTFAAQAVIAIENARLFREQQEAVERLTATSEVLEIVSKSPTDLSPVGDAIAERVMNLCNATFAAVHVLAGDELLKVGQHGGNALGRVPVIRSVPVGRAIADGTTVYFSGTEKGFQDGFPGVLELASRPVTDRDPDSPVQVVVVRLLSGGEAIGTIIARRDDGIPFAPGEVALLETFAAQAVIAIENARLFREQQEANTSLAEALDQQSGMAEVLRIISANPTDIDAVFRSLAEIVPRLVSAEGGTVACWVGGEYLEWVRGMSESVAAPITQPDVATTISDAIREGRPQEICGRTDGPELAGRYPEGMRVMRGWGFDEVSIYAAPLMRHGEAIGAIRATRHRAVPFTEQQKTLIDSFAAQAVIAIENARLFREQQEAVANLTEALNQQTALAEVLEVIASSPSKLQPVLNAIAERAKKLCDSETGNVVLVSGDSFRLVASTLFPGWDGIGDPLLERPLDRAEPVGRSILDGVPVVFCGTEDEYAAVWPVAAAMDAALFREGRPGLTASPGRALVIIPLLRDGRAIGAVFVRRRRAEPFTARQHALLETFAAQAVIAIENARLFNELQESNADLREALEREEATGEILRQISRAPEDVDTTLNAIAGAAQRLCGAQAASVWHIEGADLVSRGASTDPDSPIRRRELGSRTNLDELISSGAPGGVVIATRTLVRVDDIAEATASYGGVSAGLHQHSAMLAPIIVEDSVVGEIAVLRDEIRPFDDSEASMLGVFASQAAIAIQNALLLGNLRERNREVSEALDQQTAMAEVLQTISGSAFDADAVLQTLTERAAKLLV